MKPIYKFILHVVHNLYPLNEYSEGEIKRLMDKFKEEADDLNINITDNQLKSYIIRFDQLKNSPKIPEKDLRKYTLSKLIKLVTSTKGDESPEEEVDVTPDVVYNQNGLIIYNGSKEGNCLNYGRGERWCITKGSFSGYRYDSNKKFPTFYLVKDTNLPDDDRKSFFVVVVGEDNTYKVSDRSNNDVGGRGTEWDRWESWGFVEQNFPSIRGLHNIFKYIPLSNSEKINRKYKQKAATIGEWIKLPYSVKEQYLIIRKGNTLFEDISNDEFILKYIPKYPTIGDFLAANFGIIDSLTLLKHFDVFSNQQKNSIIHNMRDKIDLSNFSSDLLSFDVKKILVKNNKVRDIDDADDDIIDKNLFISKDGNNIVYLKVTDNGQIQMSLYNEDDFYPNVKLNKRTAKYILEYPKLDSLPLPLLLKLVKNNIIEKEVIDNILEKAKEDPNSGILIKNNIIVDINNFIAYEIEGNNIVQIPFEDEKVQNIVNNVNNVNLNNQQQERIINLFKNKKNIPVELYNNENFKNIVKNIPFNKRTWSINTNRGNEDIVLLVNSEYPYFIGVKNTTDKFDCLLDFIYNSQGHFRDNSGYGRIEMTQSTTFETYFNYLRETNQSFNDNQITRILNINRYYLDTSIKKTFISSNPPISNGNTYIPKVYSNDIYLINKNNTRQSKILGSRGKLINTNISSTSAREMGVNIPQIQGAGNRIDNPIRGRGRPSGRAIADPNRALVPTPQQRRAGVAVNNTRDTIVDNYGLHGFDQLPRSVLRRISGEGTFVTTANNRGASRRQNMLGMSGEVSSVIDIGNSTIYIIQLRNNVKVASIVVQPGNGHYLVTNNSAISLNSPSELMQALRASNLAEAHRYITNEYLDRNPHHLNEFKSLLRKHIEETKKI